MRVKGLTGDIEGYWSWSIDSAKQNGNWRLPMNNLYSVVARLGGHTMRKHDHFQILFVFIAVGMLLQPISSNAQGSGDLPALTVLVRHAERASAPADDPPLTPAGMKRAQDLAAALRDTKFSAIVT